MRILKPAVLSLLSLVAVGCGGPNFNIVRQSTPNGLQGKRAFTVAAWNWDTLVIGTRDEDKMTLEQYVAKKKPEEQEKWRAAFAGDQAGTAARFQEVLADKCRGFAANCAAPAGADALQIKVRVRVYEPGFWSPAGFGNRATHLRTTVEFADAAGNTLDEVKFSWAVSPGIYTPSTGQRMRIAAEGIASHVAKYLKFRTEAK